MNTGWLCKECERCEEEFVFEQKVTKVAKG